MSNKLSYEQNIPSNQMTHYFLPTMEEVQEPSIWIKHKYKEAQYLMCNSSAYTITGLLVRMCEKNILGSWIDIGNIKIVYSHVGCISMSFEQFPNHNFPIRYQNTNENTRCGVYTNTKKNHTDREIMHWYIGKYKLGNHKMENQVNVRERVCVCESKMYGEEKENQEKTNKIIQQIEQEFFWLPVA